MKKRLISLSVCVCILTSICTGYFATTYASATDENNVNKNLLDAVLNNRSWVIDTLINDDYSANPHAMVNKMANEKSLMATALSQYGNENDPNYSAAYKTMVDALNTWYNAGDYTRDIADGVTEWAADILEALGGSESAARTLRNCADSAKTMQYDNILQEVLKADYTSSNGQTLSGSNSQLVQLRKIQDGVGMLKSFASASKSLSGLDDGMADTAAAYADTVLFPAADAYQDVMNNVAELTGSDMGEREQVLLDLSTAMGAVAVYDSIVISKNNSGGAITIAPAYLLDDDTKKIIDINADAAKFADITIDSFMYVSSIQTQKESVAGVLDRTSAHLAAENKAKPLMTRYSDLIKDAADGKTSKYDLILTSIRNSGYIEKYVESKISDGIKKLRNRFIPCYEQSIIPGAIASVTGVIGTATYLADSVSGLKDTCTKTLELKNLNQLIEFFKATYQNDMANYRSNPTDKNAARVLDDLDFIQRLRLRGETIAYNMSKNQLDSYLGKLLSGGCDKTLADYYAYDYQRHIDTIIGASVVPFTTDSITVGNGQTLSIYYDKSYGGLYANYDKGSGNLFNSCGIAELGYRTSNGINISSGGKVLTMSDSASAYMPYVINNGGSVLLAGNMKLAELTQNSGTTQLGASTYQIDNLYLSGGAVRTERNGTITCDNMNISGAVTSNAPITCSKNMKLGGTLTGTTVYLKGDASGGGTVDNLSFCGTGTQNVTDTIYVSGTVQNTSAKVNNGQNTILKSTGTISGNHYNSGITLDGVTLNGAKTINGLLATTGTVTTDSITVNNALKQSGTLTINGNATVKSDSYFGGTVNQNNSDGTYYAAGDIIVSKTQTFNNLVLNGIAPQNISGTLNVTNLTNTNPRIINVENTVNVSGTITSEYGKINGLGTTLLSGGSFGSDTYRGDITIQSDTCNIPKNISGNTVVDANIAINRDTAIAKELTVRNKNIALNNAKLSIGGKFTNSGTITADTGQLFAYGITTNSGTINNCGSHFYKELINSGTFSGGSIATSNDIFNNGTIKTDTLSLEPNAILEVTGNNLDTGTLNLKGGGKVTLGTKINVSEEYNNAAVSVNDNNIIITSGKTITGNRTYKTFNITTDLILDGCAVTVDTMTASGGIKLINGAKLIVNKTFTASGNSKAIEIDENSEFNLKRIATLSSYTVTNNGKLTFGGDTSLSSTKLTGSGTITVKADLLGSMTINKPKNFNITGRTPQTIQCSGANFDNLNINNPCKSGVTLSGTVYYSSSLNTNNTKINGNITQK